jgi:hypothetical protein
MVLYGDKFQCLKSAILQIIIKLDIESISKLSRKGKKVNLSPLQALVALRVAKILGSHIFRHSADIWR